MIVTLCYFAVGIAFAAGRSTPFYRRDYHYVEEYDSFYKLHWDIYGLSWNAAFLACEDEGSKLFYPRLPDEYKVVNNLTEMAKEQPNVTDIFIGIHDEFGVGEYITIDGKPTPLPIPDNSIESAATKKCITMNPDDGSFSFENCETFMDTIRPFVCKREIEQTPCPTIDKGYKYVSETKKCYKFNTRTKTWNEAMQTCFMEGGSLLIAKDSTEADIVRRIIENQRSSDQNSAIFVGFRRLFNNGDFYTVKGESFLNGYYSTVGNSNLNENGDCGAMVKYYENLRLESRACHESHSFICQIETF